jgi:hypothetical protein
VVGVVWLGKVGKRYM